MIDSTNAVFNHWDRLFKLKRNEVIDILTISKYARVQSEERAIWKQRVLFWQLSRIFHLLKKDVGENSSDLFCTIELCRMMSLELFKESFEEAFSTLCPIALSETGKGKFSVPLSKSMSGFMYSTTFTGSVTSSLMEAYENSIYASPQSDLKASSRENGLVSWRKSFGDFLSKILIDPFSPSSSKKLLVELLHDLAEIRRNFLLCASHVVLDLKDMVSCMDKEMEIERVRIEIVRLVEEAFNVITPVRYGELREGDDILYDDYCNAVTKGLTPEILFPRFDAENALGDRLDVELTVVKLTRKFVEVLQSRGLYRENTETL